MQFTQKTENKLTTRSGDISLSSSSGIGKKRTLDIMNDDGTDVSIVNEKQQGGKQTDGLSDIAGGELDSFITSISSEDNK